MANTISFSSTGFMGIEAEGGDSDDPMTFDDIVSYFEANPIAADFTLPQVYGGSPWELCEENADEWEGINGMGTPADDGVDYNDNSYSVTAEITSVPSADTSATKIRVYGQDVYVYIPSASSTYSVDEKVRISGTTNFDGFYQINYTSSTYIRFCLT